MTLVVSDDRRVMLVKPRYRRRWCLPGGWLEPGEDPQLGAAREVAEETGIVLRSIPRLLASYSRNNHRDHLFIGSSDTARSGRATTPWEIAATRWADVGDLETLDPVSRRMFALVPGGITAAIDVEHSRPS